VPLLFRDAFRDGLLKGFHCFAAPRESLPTSNTQGER